jgi:hypothetical protein
MTQQLGKYPELQPSMAEDQGYVEIIERSPRDTPSDLTEELESVAKLVRNRLGNMTANIVEIGRELRAVKQRLEHGQFLNWVEADCRLSARTAQLMMKAAEWAEGKNEIVAHLEPTAIYLLAAPSTPDSIRRQVLSGLEHGQRPTPRLIKDMIRAAKERTRPPRERTSQATNSTQLRGAQSDRTQTEAAEKGQDDRSEPVVLEQEGPEGMRLEGDAAHTEPSRRVGPAPQETNVQEKIPGGPYQAYPDIDPLTDRDPPWINGALRLVPLLAEALPLENGVPNCQALVHGALQLIPALTEAVLELHEIPKRQLIAALLKYCGYNNYAARLSRRSPTESALRDSDNGNDFEAVVASFRDTTPTVMPGRIVTEPRLGEAADVA